MNAIDYIVKYLGQDFPMELFGWLGYIFIHFITRILYGYFAFVQGILPLYCWNLFWHPNGGSILDVLRNSEGNGWLISSSNQAHCCWFREQACPVPRWVWWRKPCRLQFHWSTIAPDKTLFKDMIRGYVCIPTIKFTQQVLSRPTELHHLKMESQLTSSLILCPGAQDSLILFYPDSRLLERWDQGHHQMDSFLPF